MRAALRIVAAVALIVGVGTAAASRGSGGTFPAVSSFDPRFSPDGAWIAYQREAVSGGRAAIWLMRADGAQKHSLTPAGFEQASWSADGRALAFQSIGNPSDVFTIPFEGGPITRLTDAPDLDFYPRFAPDGTRIAFVKGSFDDLPPPSVLDVYSMKPDGSDRKRLTQFGVGNAGLATGPEWAPNGNRILFLAAARAGGDGFQLHLMNADGSGQREVTHLQAQVDEYAWAPNGRRIAFTTVWGRGFYTVNTTDGTVRRRTRTVDYEPAWSPDGRTIALRRVDRE
ncbi:MAG: TolB protein, partial [Gaiellaceae bacterium]|nr:TolB protein [Gaiellaceae bacterium]